MNRARSLFVFIVLIVFAAALSACGSSGSDDPQSVVDEATLQGVDSGKIDLAVKADVQGKKGGDLNISLSGPFQSEEDAETPDLDLSFSVDGTVDNEKIDREGGLTLLGNKAFVGYEGTEYEVDPTTFNFVKSMIKQQGDKGNSSDVSACQEAAGDFELKNFVENLKDEGSADVGGTETTKISADLNGTGAVEAFSKLIEDPACSAQLKAAGPLPSAAELEEAKSTIKDSLKSAHVELYVGDDHIVRRVTAKGTIEPSADSKVSAERVDLDLDLTLTGVNEEQTISAPDQTKPLSDLFLKLGINPIELLQEFQGGTPDLEGLLEKFGSAGSGQPDFKCLGKAETATDLQNCAGSLQ